MGAGGSAVGVDPAILVKRILSDAAEFLKPAPQAAGGPPRERTIAIMSRGDGSSHGHFQSHHFFIESIAFAEDPATHDPEHNHVIPVARMGETRANELEVLSRTFAILQELHGTKIVAVDG